MWLRSFSRFDDLPLSALGTVCCSSSPSVGGCVGVLLLSVLFLVPALGFLPFRVRLRGLWFAVPRVRPLRCWREIGDLFVVAVGFVAFGWGIAPSVAPAFRVRFPRRWLGFVVSRVSRGSASLRLGSVSVALRSAHFGSSLAVGGFVDGGSSVWLRPFSRLDLLPLAVLGSVPCG